MLTKLEPTFQIVLSRKNPFRNQVKGKTIIEGRLQTSSRLNSYVSLKCYEYLSEQIGLIPISILMYGTLGAEYCNVD